MKTIKYLTEAEIAELPKLPDEWKWVNIESLIENDKNSLKAGPFDSSLKKEFYVPSGFKIYGQEQVILGDCAYGNYYISKEKYAELENCKIKPFDILISLVGTIGKVLILPENCEEGIINPHLIKISLNRNYYWPVFFKYYFESMFLKSLYKVKAHGATMDILNLGIVKELPFPLCSLPEQRAIVSKIEQLFSELDNGIANLKLAQEHLKVYRQAVLKKAFEGELTKKWREQQTDLPDTGNLLEQIRSDREKAAKSAGKNVKNIKPPTEMELAKLPIMPKEWIWVKLDYLGDLGRGKSKHRPRNDKILFGGKYPFIQTGEVKAANHTIKSFEKTYSDFGLAQSKLWPKGTLCITIAANIAETAFLGFEGCFPDSIVGFTAAENIVMKEYICYFLRAINQK